ncbi:hypothetical protein TNCV_1954421 [Trichonephila clavipes]|nr:hypothetical protein TNCV_1954421 [Trichonephila clavipes]
MLNPSRIKGSPRIRWRGEEVRRALCRRYLTRDVIRHGPTGSKTGASSRSRLSCTKSDLNNFSGHVLFPVVFSEKLGNSNDMSTGYV